MCFDGQEELAAVRMVCGAVQSTYIQIVVDIVKEFHHSAMRQKVNKYQADGTPYNILHH